MAVGIASAKQAGGTFTFEVCPAWDTTAKGCACPKDASGNPTPSHQTFDFGATLPPGDARTPAQWARACAQEALLLVKAQQAPPATPLAALVGVSI
jgi:hypothetical protein